ncbi:uncharacterized protein LOC141895194 isoform X2 [Acropora palmata]|uniref:uncharacterized protein LOC141895194 isoform X2 n=1 Tax=Acropora palmata TaxID=6131 RepID=UPI003D9FCB36
MSSADRFRLNSTRSFPLLMECQFVSDVNLGPSACEVQCRTSGQDTPSTRRMGTSDDNGMEHGIHPSTKLTEK